MAVRGDRRPRRLAVLLALVVVLAGALAAAPSTQAATSTRFTIVTPPGTSDPVTLYEVGDQRWICEGAELNTSSFAVTDRSNHLLHTWTTPLYNCGGVGTDTGLVGFNSDGDKLVVVSAADGSSREVDPTAGLPADVRLSDGNIVAATGDKAFVQVANMFTQVHHLLLIDLNNGDVKDLGTSAYFYAQWNESAQLLAKQVARTLEVARLENGALTSLGQLTLPRGASFAFSADGQYLYVNDVMHAQLLTYSAATLTKLNQLDFSAITVKYERYLQFVPLSTGFLAGFTMESRSNSSLAKEHFVIVNAAGSKIVSRYDSVGADATTGYAMAEGANVAVLFNDQTLGVFKDAGLTDSVLTLVMGRPNRAGTATGHGTLTIGGAAAAARPLTLTITNGAQTDTVPLTTTSTGAFSFHRSVASGWTQFTVSFAATATQSGATVAHRTRPRVVPYDFNGDSRADLVSSTVYATVAGHTRAGQITVLPGAAKGVTTTGAALLTQAIAGVAGDPGNGAFFGWTTASGDINGDGYADLVVSAPAIGSHSLPGEVVELFGSASGLTTAKSVRLREPNDNRWPQPYPGDAVAVGDLDGDSYDDVMVGEPGADRVRVYAHASSHSGALTHPDLHTDHVERPATASWGSALATGDVNGDGFDDLAIGSPTDANGLPFISGSVTVVNGSEHGWTTKRQITLNTAGVPSSPTRAAVGEYYDGFGGALSFGDLNGDGKDDLVVGAPGVDVVVGAKRVRDAGAVYAFRGASSGLSLSGVRRFTQATSGVAGTPRQGDLWGNAVSTADATGDHLAETAVGGADGLAVVFRGASVGLSASHAQWFNQDSPGIAGTSSASNGFGATLRFGDFTGDGKADLAVGAPGWNGGVGMLSVLYSGAHGLTGVGSTSLNPNSPGVPGTSHTKWYFGWLY